MASAASMAGQGGASEAAGVQTGGKMEMEAYRRIFPLAYYEHHFREGLRPDARPLHSSRPTKVSLGPISSADGSALIHLGCTTMLSGVKLEVMTPSKDSLDEGCIAVEFYMPPICSPNVRPGRPVDIAPVISKQLLDVIRSSGMINLKDLCLISGKASWMAYLDIYCLNADGSLFDAALMAATAALRHLEIPLVSMNDDGRVFVVSGDQEVKTNFGFLNKEKRKLPLANVPFSLTFGLHKDYILADPTAEEEESIVEASLSVVLDKSDRLISIYKPGGAVVSAHSIKECISLTRHLMKEFFQEHHFALSC